ncbi:MAG: hypothetical protein WC668_05060 [Patescibacteria group bacterium]|jgi:hypothetical protein
MVQKKIAETQVPNYAPIPHGGRRFFLSVIFISFGFVMMFVALGQAYLAAGIGWKLLTGVCVIGISYILFGPPLSFWKEYYRRNIRGYILIIRRNQDLSDESFYLTTYRCLEQTIREIKPEKHFYIVLILGGWFADQRFNSCRQRLSRLFRSLLVQTNNIKLSFRYVDKVKSSISAPEGWLIEIRDQEGNRIVCDWRKAFVLLKEIGFLPKELNSGSSGHIIFDVLISFIKRSIWLASAKLEKKELVEKVELRQKDLLTLLLDCLDGIKESKRFIQSQEAQRLRLSLAEKWLPRMTWLPDWDPRRQELEKMLKHHGKTGRSQPENKPDKKDDPAEAEEPCSGCTLCGTSSLPAVSTPALK